MRSAVIVFPGTNCESETFEALDFMGFNPEYVFHKEETDLDYDLVFLPGGFSYGDYLRAGAVAAFSPITKKLNSYIIKKKGFTVGVCNGFQLLCEANFIPGALTFNENNKFICDNTSLLFDNAAISLPIAHKEGRFFADEKQINEIKSKKMDFLTYESNPNGSICNIAGLYDREKLVMGLMPHPERAIFEYQAGTDGLIFFEYLKSEMKKNGIV